MMENSNNTPSSELRAAIDVAKQRIKVDTYFTIAMNKGLKGHAQGYWAGTLMGMCTGALGGGLLSGALAMVPALPAIATGLIGWPLVLGVSGLGAVMGGVTIGGDLGRAAGTSAGVMAEKERREKAAMLEKEILASPQKQREVIEAYRKDPVVEKDNTPGEIFATTRDPLKAWNKLIDLPTMALTVALCAAAGVVMFSGWFALAGGAGAVAAGGVLGQLGITSYNMAIAVGGALGATSGVTFGITYPAIFAGLTKVVADILSQKFVRGKSNFSPVRTAQEMLEESVQVRTASPNAITRIAPRIAANSNEPMPVVSAVQNDGVTTPAPQLSLVKH